MVAPPVARGVLLRSVLLLELDASGGAPLTVGQLCAAVERRGLGLAARPSKIVSDALRCEVVSGRVRQVSRGRYRIGRFAKVTRWRCRQRVQAALAGRAPQHHLH